MLATSAGGAATAQAAAPPSNDAFSAAAPLAVGQEISSTNLDATAEAGEPNAASVALSAECAAFTDGPQCGASVWYTLTPASSGTLTIETCDRGTDMDSVLGVYTGATIGAAVLVTANDDACAGGYSNNGSRVSFSATAGTTYHVLVTGFVGEMGSFYLRSYSGAPVARPVPDTAIPRDGSLLSATNTFGNASVLSGLRHTPSFPFISTPRGGSFECSLDGAAFAGCSSPVAFDSLSDGDHTFAIRASFGGATDPTPVIERFRIDTAPPDTALSGPSGDTPSTTAQWLLTSTKRNGSGGHWNCRFDGQAAISCSRNRSFSSLCMGAHTFDAASWDLASNLDASPSAASINVTTGTACAPPTVSNTTTTTLFPTNAAIQYPVDDKGAGATLRVEYGKTTGYGEELKPSFRGPGPAGTGVSIFQFLDPGTLYHYRVTVTTPFGTQSTGDQTFTTTALGATTLPAVQTDDPTAIGHYASRLPVRIDAAGMDTFYAAFIEPAGRPVTAASPSISGDGILLGTIGGPQAGSVSLVDLEPGKSYDYRIGASHQGTDNNGVLGPTRTFTVPDFPGPSGGGGGGGGTTGGTNTTPAIPVIPTAGAASLASRTAKVTKGKVALRLRCSAAGPCAGSLEIDATGASAARKKKKPKKTVVARGRYSIPAGTTATVTVPLNRKGRKLLRKHHGKLSTKLVLTPTGGTKTTSALTLKQVATKRKKPKR